MLLSTVRLVLSDRHRHDVIRMLRIYRGHTTAKAACLAFDVSQDLMDANILTITERWATRSDLDAHVRSVDYKLLLAVIELGTAPPEIQFDVTERIGGLDVVWALRLAQPSDPEAVRQQPNE